MEAVKISDFKAHLAQYLRRVKNGGELELLDRGSPVVHVTSARVDVSANIIAPAKSPEGLGKIKSKVKNFTGEAMDTLNEERERR